MHCYECLHDFWTAFWLLLSHFWPFFSHWPWLGLYRPIFGPFLDQNIFILGWFLTIFRVDPGRLTWFLHGSIALIALFKIRFGISTHFSDPNSPKWQIFGVKRPITAQNAPKRPENGQKWPKNGPKNSPKSVRWAAPWQANQLTVTSCVVVEQFSLSKTTLFLFRLWNISKKIMCCPLDPPCFGQWLHFSRKNNYYVFFTLIAYVWTVDLEEFRGAEKAWKKRDFRKKNTGFFHIAKPL